MTMVFYLDDKKEVSFESWEAEIIFATSLSVGAPSKLKLFVCYSWGMNSWTHRKFHSFNVKIDAGTTIYTRCRLRHSYIC